MLMVAWYCLILEGILLSLFCKTETFEINFISQKIIVTDTHTHTHTHTHTLTHSHTPTHTNTQAHTHTHTHIHTHTHSHIHTHTHTHTQHLTVVKALCWLFAVTRNSLTRFIVGNWLVCYWTSLVSMLSREDRFLTKDSSLELEMK